MANLKRVTNTYKNTAAISLYVSSLSAMVTTCLAVSAYAYFNPQLSTTGLSIVFFSGCIGTIFFMQKDAGKKTTSKLCTIEIMATLTDAIRIYFCFLIINTNTEINQCLILTAASVVGSAISIIPAGLGVREGASALIATQISISSSKAFIALAINRALGLSFFFLLAIPISIIKSKETPSN